MDAPLWRPSPERIAASGISRLAVEAERRWGVRCEDFSALHRWSVEAPEQFWCEVWRLAGAVVAAVPDNPRTRSGKIVELAVRDVVHGRAIRNREAIANPEALDDFAAWAELARC